MKQYKIVIDTLGSDKGAEAVILGASLALNEHPDLCVTLVGPEELINEISESAKTRVLTLLRFS